jgi:hypothetical protein
MRYTQAGKMYLNFYQTALDSSPTGFSKKAFLIGLVVLNSGWIGNTILPVMGRIGKYHSYFQRALLGRMQRLQR